MPLHLGLDEAGLGPTLGPLCFGACQWEHPGSRDAELFAALTPLVTAPGQGGTLLLGDSKALHAGKGRIARLEAQVLTFVSFALGDCPHSFRDLWQSLCGSASTVCSLTDTKQPPWLIEALSSRLPLQADRQAILANADRLATHALGIGLARPTLRARVLCAPSYNLALKTVQDRGGTKNNLVGEQVLALAASFIHPKQSPARITFDKLGGRNRYAPLLAQAGFGDIEILQESGEQSCYLAQTPYHQRVHLQFMAKSEAVVPSVALAACIAKYLREVVMSAFSAHFLAEFPGVAPTAGYPQDAKRFLHQLAAHDTWPHKAASLGAWVRRA